MAFAIHKLKIQHRFAESIMEGDKTSEVRLDDRDFQKGDMISFEVVNDSTGKDLVSGIVQRELDKVNFTITHVLRGGQFGIDVGFVVLSFEKHI